MMEYVIYNQQHPSVGMIFTFRDNMWKLNDLNYSLIF